MKRKNIHRKNIHRPQPLAGGARPKSTAVCPTLQLRSIKVHHEALKAFLKAFLKNKNNNNNKNKNNNDNNDNNDNDHGCCFPVSQGFETCAVWASSWVPIPCLVRLPATRCGAMPFPFFRVPFASRQGLKIWCRVSEGAPAVVTFQIF